jgi:hypothetical protein
VWALAACGSVSGPSSGTQGNQARPLSQQYVLQTGSQSQISDLAHLKRNHTSAPLQAGITARHARTSAVKDLAKVKREALLRTAWAVWARTPGGPDGPLAGHTLQFVASLISQGAQIVTIRQSDPFVLV